MRAKDVGIGEASERTGVHVETIRYYEKIGIMPSPPRTSGGHRVYGEGLVSRLSFISRSRELGFSLEEIRRLLGLVDNQTVSCCEVREVALRHVESISAKIADLRRLESVLTELADKCEGGEAPECPIIEALSTQGSPLFERGKA